MSKAFNNPSTDDSLKRPGRPSVAVFGGGVGGLTAAHVLARRGFDVQLYERHDILGGKTRSWPLAGTGTGGRADLPSEFGPHLLLGSYRNVGETLGEIPIGGGRTVLDNLTYGNPRLDFSMSWSGKELQFPFPSLPYNKLVNVDFVLKSIFGAQRMLGGGTLSLKDKAILSTKFAALVTSGEKRQRQHFENISLADYVRADRLSPNARRLLQTSTQANPGLIENYNTRVYARCLVEGVAMMLGDLGPGFTDTLAFFTSPTNDAWFNPWGEYLESLGVTINLGHRLMALDFSDGMIAGATVKNPDGETKAVSADWYILAVPFDKAAELMSPALTAADPALGRIANIKHSSWLGAGQIYLTKKQTPFFGTAYLPADQPWAPAIVDHSKLFKGSFRDTFGDGTVVQYLSIDVGNWDEPGILYGKSAKQCSEKEFFEEFRAQVRASCGDETALAHADIHSCDFNPAITRPGGDEVATHDEPELGVDVGCWANQPTAVTGVPNLFLAAAYVQTGLAIDSTDSANEAGKHAANGVLTAAGSTAPHAPIGATGAPRGLQWLWDKDDRRFDRGLPNVFDRVAPVAP